MVTRMDRVEVLKGPAAIRFGPNTVGGAVNMMSARIPDRLTLFADVAGGNTGYGKFHGRVGFGLPGNDLIGDGRGTGGGLIEAVLLRSDGFKVVDGGAEAGFDKFDVATAVFRSTNPRLRVRHEAWARLSIAGERSAETYTGLSIDDFRASPWRRYRSTGTDLMTWSRMSAVARWRTIAPDWSLTGHLYTATLDRRWSKLNGFRGGRGIAEVLQNPGGGSNALLYGVLTGERDSATTDEQLLYGANDRQLNNIGAQVEATADFMGLGADHQLLLGVRLHRDGVVRRHDERPHDMRDGELVVDPNASEAILLDAQTSAIAIAGWLQDTAKWGDLTVTPGLRYEHVFRAWDDHQDDSRDSDGSYSALIPGLGLLYKMSKPLALLAGVNRGFVPVAPGNQGNADPESSWNTEAGARWTAKRLRWDLVGFWSEYGNLKGTCTFSSGCAAGQVGTEFNGGEVRTLGVEASVQTLLKPIKRLRVPLRLSYTYTRARFLTGFVSPNPQWGRVEAGDELPYIPPHQLSVQAGIGQRKWELNAAYRYTAAMRDQAGQQEDSGGNDGPLFTDEAHVIDLAARVQLSKLVEVYLTCNNLLDNAYIVSHRPFGARPGMRRLVIAGLKVHWERAAVAK